MELNSSTFILEIINFLVLVWILKRFFYRPVLDAVARRKAGVEATLAKAELLRNTAEDLHQQYETRLADWEREKQLARQSLDDDIRQEREKQLAVLRTELKAERDTEQVLIGRKLEGEHRKLVDTALLQGARFATRLLSAVSGPELEQRLVALLVNELEKLPAGKVDQLRTVNGMHTGDAPGKSSNEVDIIVTSAYPVDEANRQTLEQACKTTLQVNGQFHYRQDPDLIAGLRISIGSWVLATNLQDELKGFAGFEHGR